MNQADLIPNGGATKTLWLHFPSWRQRAPLGRWHFLTAIRLHAAESSRASSRQNLSLSLNSRSCQFCSHTLPSGSLYSKLSGSLQSLTSVSQWACDSRSHDHLPARRQWTRMASFRFGVFVRRRMTCLCCSHFTLMFCSWIRPMVEFSLWAGAEVKHCYSEALL